jgi:uncharacterized protein YdaU (DUF1376 family)
MTESGCDREQLRDYAFDELAGAARAAMEGHIAGCAECAAELAQLELTTAALRVLPDQEIPQRIAFVSDKVFEPSPVARFFSAFWNSGARLGFVSACMLAAALFANVWRRPIEIRTETKTMVPANFSQQIDARVNKAVSDAVARVHEEDARVLKAAIESADHKSEQRRRALMVAMSEEMNTLQKRLGVYTEYAMAAPERPASGGASQ